MSEYLNLSGKIKWANGKSGGLFSPDPEYGNYKCQLYPDQESWDKIKKSNLNLKTRNDDDGDYLIFKREPEKLINGELTVFGPPKVYFPEDVEGTKDIGNDSEVDVSVVVYKAGKHYGHRLNSVTVTSLIKYQRAEGAAGGAPRGFKAFGEENESEAENEEAPKVEKSAPFNLNDEIPFGKSEPQEEVKTVKRTPFRR